MYSVFCSLSLYTHTHTHTYIVFLACHKRFIEFLCVKFVCFLFISLSIFISISLCLYLSLCLCNCILCFNILALFNFILLTVAWFQLFYVRAPLRDCVSVSVCFYFLSLTHTFIKAFYFTKKPTHRHKTTQEKSDRETRY